MTTNWTRMMSLVSRGTRYQLRVAAALMTVIPLLAVCFIALTPYFPRGTYSLAVKAAVAVLAGLIAASGYVILWKYPQNILKLREYLREIVAGNLPEKITLLNSEDDIRAIENYLNSLLLDLRRKVEQLEAQLHLSEEMKKAIEAQQGELLEAERHRVMIQSLGAACHHIGQPSTVLRAHLHLLKRHVISPRELAGLEQCERAVDEIAEILDKLRGVSEYRTVPYRMVSGGEDKEILDIETAGAPPADQGPLLPGFPPPAGTGGRR